MPSVTTIVIKGNGQADGFVHLSQVEVINTKGVNIAPTAQATQSDTYENNIATYGAQRAIDGNLNSFAHTGSNVPGAFWMLTFPAPVDIYQIILRNRRDACQHRLKGAHLSAINQYGQVVFHAVLTETHDQSFIFPTWLVPQ